MNYVVFGHKGFPYEKLLNILPDKEEIFFIGRLDENGVAKENNRCLPLSDLVSLDPQAYTAVVASPYWIQPMLAFQPKRIIAHLLPCPEHEDQALWNKLTGLLASYADLIITGSERMYMEQCLQRDKVFLLGDSEDLLRSAIAAMLKGELLEPWVIKQWGMRKQYYHSLHEQQGPHETICYLLASYLYFLGDASAKEYLGLSFEQMILKDYSQCLNSHYRFFSAIEADAGDLEKAARIYEITAISQEERKNIEVIKEWRTQGEWGLIQAEIYRANEDYRSAIHVLESMNSLPSITMQLQNYLHIFRWKDALRIFDNSLLSDANRIMAEVIRGNIHLIHNRTFLAIHTFLRASVEDWNVFSNINEMLTLEQALKRS